MPSLLARTHEVLASCESPSKPDERVLRVRFNYCFLSTRAVSCFAYNILFMFIASGGKYLLRRCGYVLTDYVKFIYK